jgi:hypothetical protein
VNRNKIYEDLNFSSEFSVEEWNALIQLKLGKYFPDETVFEKNKELLRTEIVNYIRCYAKSEYFTLFEWTHDLYKACIIANKRVCVKMLADSFDATSGTDMTWMTNVLTQPDHNSFSERDKISYYFKIIDETLEGAFKPRFKLLDKFVAFNLNGFVTDNSTFDFGRLIRDFPAIFKSKIDLFLKDPFFSISTNQWRNIAAHKSFIINKDNIVIKYGQVNIHTLTISYDDFYKIVYWTQDIYRAIRLGQVFTDLNHIEEIVAELGGTENISIRFESTLLHIIHNMQIVGFEFVSTNEKTDTFCLNVKGKVNCDLKSSLIHASQCLDQLSYAIYDDKFVRDNFQKAQICIVDENKLDLASATIPINIALRKAKNEIGLDEYLDNMDFDIFN